MAEKVFGEMPSLTLCEMQLLGTVLFLPILYSQRHQRISVFWELCLFATRNVFSVTALISCYRLRPHRGGGMEAVGPFWIKCLLYSCQGQQGTGFNGPGGPFIFSTHILCYLNGSLGICLIKYELH